MSDLKVKGQNHWERKCKHRFRAFLRQRWIDLRQTKIKIGKRINAHIVEYVSPANW